MNINKKLHATASSQERQKKLAYSAQKDVSLV